MPYKRRQAKGRLIYSPTVQSLLDGAPVPRTADVRDELFGLQYFSWSDKAIPAEISLLAAAELDRWDAEDRACR
jgi:hypothetical protein